MTSNTAAQVRELLLVEVSPRTSGCVGNPTPCVKRTEVSTPINYLNQLISRKEEMIMNDLTMQELRELQVEIDQIGEDFAEIEVLFGKQAFGFAAHEESSEALNALNVN